MTLAYFDSFAGLVPCRIDSFYSGNWGKSDSQIKIRFTATRGHYKRGEAYTTSLRHVVPRSAVYRSRQHCGQYRIKPYSWEKESV